MTGAGAPDPPEPRGWRRQLPDLAHIAEIVGTVAVVISLLYVGVQLRQATRQMEREENNATQAQWQTIRLLLATDRDVARLWHAGLNGDSLDAIDRVRFDRLFSEHTWATFHIRDRARLGIFPWQEFERGGATRLVHWICTPGGSPWWRENRTGYPPDFVADVGVVMDRVGSAEAPPCPGRETVPTTLP